MHAHLDGLLDIGGLGRPTDQIYRPYPFWILLTKQLPSLFEVGHNLAVANYDNMVFRQKIERGGRLFPGNQHQCTGFSDPTHCRGDRGMVLLPSCPFRRLDGFRPLYPGNEWVSRSHNLMAQRALG